MTDAQKAESRSRKNSFKERLASFSSSISGRRIKCDFSSADTVFTDSSPPPTPFSPSFSSPSSPSYSAESLPSEHHTTPNSTISRCKRGFFHPTGTCNGDCASSQLQGPYPPDSSDTKLQLDYYFELRQPGQPVLDSFGRSRHLQSCHRPRTSASSPQPPLRRRNAKRRPSRRPFAIRNANCTQDELLRLRKARELKDMASRPESMMVQGGPREYKQRAVQEARAAQETIDRWLSRNNSSLASKYEFRELIGKGSYGRVYKSIEHDTERVVAIKVLAPDEMDLNVPAEARDTGLQDALKEINILERLKQSGAINVNEFVEAFTVHSQLWLVSEYCSGGSLSTLKRAAGGKLEERYIRAIARELSKGLVSVHKAGIVHRDIKCANVMISESGGLQIIDFGVSAVLISNMEEDKRKTIIGTPHWMPPELQQAPNKEVPHGSEVDVWAFGITLYECAMGVPPNATTTQQARLRAMLKQAPPRLPEDKFSADLRDLVAFVLNPDPKARPSMEEVCSHPYVIGSETKYPTSSLRNLVELYYNWERGGGQRASLWYAGGAAQASIEPMPGQDEWVFSTTQAFDRMHGDEYDSSFDLSSSPPREADEWDEDVAITHTLRPTSDVSGVPHNDRAAQVAQARRGAKLMAGLFDQSVAPYKLGDKPTSDLPLRSGDSGSSLHRKEVSVSSNDDGTPQINLNAIDSKKASKRATMAWKWNENLARGEDAESLLPQRPPLPHANTLAFGELPTTRQAARDTLDLDALMGGGHSKQAARETLDLDAMMGSKPRQSVRETLDLDALMDLRPSQHTARDTLDLDALMGGSSAATMPPPQAGPMAASTPPNQDNRQTLDLDALMGGLPSNASGNHLDPAFTFDDPVSEATMRPASQFQSRDFAAQPKYDFAEQQQSSGGRRLSSEPRHATLDLDALMAGGNASMLDAVMAGDHDYEGPSGASTAAATDDEGEMGDFSTLGTSRNSVNANANFASSPPESPFGGVLQAIPQVPDYPLPIDPASLRDDAPEQLVEGEVQRLLSAFNHVLDITQSLLSEADHRFAHAAQPNGHGHAKTDSQGSSIRGEIKEDAEDGDREDE